MRVNPYVYMHVLVYVCMYDIYIYVCVYVPVCMCMYVCMVVCTFGVVYIYHALRLGAHTDNTWVYEKK